jgi:phosphatidylglycerophosphate synthase
VNGVGVRAVQSGLLVGVLCALATVLLVRRGMRRHDVARLGPADRVTLVRAVLSCGVAALAGASLPGASVRPVLVAVAAVALALDWVDGRVARRTGTVSAFGAAFDMEVDAFLVLVLSIDVGAALGPWVLLAGAARYLLLLACWCQPWLGRPMPTRYWAKVVAAGQGVVLTVAAADLLPGEVATGAVAIALLALAVSFGHQVWWLRGHRPVDVVHGAEAHPEAHPQAHPGTAVGA